MTDSVFIQKQIKDNTEDLHNFVRDLKLWEEEMKRKDRQLSNEPSEEVLPPVRRAKKTSKEISVEQEKRENKKRIPSHDYKSWEKFDVDKACEEIDNNKNKKEEEVDEDPLIQEKYLQEKALYEKELGNKHVKACKWDEAIEAYTRAIAAYSRDPVFFANRALCYLKKKKYTAVEDDCTESLKLDPTYVKALMRRAAAREALGDLEGARHDLYQTLQLEPNNPQAARDLARVKAAAAVDSKKDRVEQPTKKDSAATHKKIEEKSIHIKPSVQNKTPTTAKEDKNKSQSTSKLEAKSIEPVQSSLEPPWQPCSNTGDHFVKPPHLRSKKNLKRIEIHDVGVGAPKHVCRRKLAKAVDPSSETVAEKIKEEDGKSNENPLNTHNQTSPLTTTSRIGPQEIEGTFSTASKSIPNQKIELDVKFPNLRQNELSTSTGEKPRSILTVLSTPSDVPPPPKTAVQFHTSWNSIKSDTSKCYRFLKQIPGDDLPDIFKESLESGMFSSIVEVLATEFVAAGEPVLPYLRGLSAVRRFTTIALFMGSADKQNLTKLFDYCASKNECPQESILQLRRLYEMV